MNTHDILRDAASRPGIEAAVAVKGLSAEALNAHPGGHPNSIAWLLWHAGRQMDMQLSTLNGQPQVWEAQGFRERFNLGELGDTIGYGHTPEQARSIVVADSALLVEYLVATGEALAAYAQTLSEADLSEVIDRSWTPAVTRGVRLVSLIDDAAQHVGQAAYAAGILAAQDFAAQNLTPARGMKRRWRLGHNRPRRHRLHI